MIRYKDENGDNHYADTYNASSLPIERTIAAILENYQKENKIEQPKILATYFPKKE